MSLDYLVVRSKKHMYEIFHTLVIQCQHSLALEKQWDLSFIQLPIPIEMLKEIRSHIKDATTYTAFAKAFKIPMCKNSFCQMMAEQKWLETGDCLSKKSIAETEYSKIGNDLRYLSLLFPTSYKITKRDNGFAITSYKKHMVPLNYTTIFSTPSRIYTPYIDRDNFQAIQNDPMGRHFMYTPYRVIHIYDTYHQKYYLNITESLPMNIVQKYKDIEDIFKTLKKTSLKIEPWTVCYHKASSKWEPCQEWIDYLYIIYQFQQKKSLVLKQLRRNVS